MERSENKNVVFNFWQNHTPAIENKVRTGELDIGFGGYLDGKEDMEFFPLMNQEVVVITPKEHVLKAEEAIALEELGNFPVIGYDSDGDQLRRNQR